MVLGNFICFFGFFLMLFNLVVVEGEIPWKAFHLNSAPDPAFADEQVDLRNKSLEEYVHNDDGGDKMDAYADEYDEEELESLDVSIRAILNCPVGVTCPPGELCTMNMNIPNCFHPAAACKFLACKNGGTCNNERCDCKLGFSGHICTDTTTRSNGCYPGFCQNGGRCLNSIPPTCACIGSYSGQRCQVASPVLAPSRPCSSVVCANGGTCVPLGNSYRCACLPQYTGHLCRTNLCLRFCYNGGRCSVIGSPPRPTCTCVAPYSGQRCYLTPTILPAPHPCVRVVCANGGTCVPLGNSYRCACLPQYTGHLCRTNLCLRFCYNGGRCSMIGSPPRPTCTCVAPYSGQRCYLTPTILPAPDPCVRVVCFNGGTCVPQRTSNGNYTAKCVCHLPYQGLRCQVNRCLGYCRNGGRCSLVGNITSCACLASYTGPRCLTLRNVCRRVVCANGGTCHPEGDTFRCDCRPSFSGKTCNLTSPCHNFCYNGGACYLYGNYTKCVCRSPYVGLRCQDNYCTDHCENGGNCSLVGPYRNITSCACAPPFTGATCQTRLNVCDGVVCANGGTCHPEGDTYRCDCRPPFSGKTCNLTSPCHNFCYNGGACYLYGNYTKCVCRSPYVGLRCQDNYCTDHCKNGGNCSLVGPYRNITSCDCAPPFTGVTCQARLNVCAGVVCANGGTCQPNGSTFRCSCIIPFTGQLCRDNLCSGYCYNGGYCRIIDRIRSCACGSSFTGERCQTRIPQSNHPCDIVKCANGGTCIRQGFSFRCSCVSPYTGRYCQSTGRPLPPHPCSQVVCAHDGTCVPQGNSFRCSCTPQYTGRYCQIRGKPSRPRPCNIVICAHGGTCIPQGNSFRCLCVSPYTGRYCHTDRCSGFCFNRGTCSLVGNSPTCSCFDSYTGQRCERPLVRMLALQNCDFVVCENGGTCVQQGSSYRCSCLLPFTGTLCQDYNPSINDQCPGYCYNGGHCRMLNSVTPTCTCVGSYTGRRCQVAPPILPPPPRPCSLVVCANGGTCIPQGNSYTCLCVPPYTGQLCQTNLCLGYCYHGGSCTLINANAPICTCVASYSGQRCEITPAVMPRPPQPCLFVVCANGGTCVQQGSSFRCSCKFPYTGPHCQTSPCSDYCLKNGQCTMINGIPSCVCSPPYSGKRCTELLNDPCENAFCPQDQTCQPVGTTYRCTRVEPPSAVCQPDPCQGDCRCTPSCKHEGGYVCVTDRGFLGRHCDIPIPEIRCSADKIVVEVSPRFYNEFDADQRNSILFMSPSADGVGRSTTQCQSRLVDGSYRIAVSHPFTQCGTTVGTERGPDGGDMVVFTNEVWLNKNFGQGSGYDMPFPVVRLQCKYNDEYVIYTSLKPTVAPVHGLVFGNIQYDVTPTICKVSTCGESCPQQFAVQKSAVFTVGQIIHFGFDVTSRSSKVNEGTATLLHSTVSCSDSLDVQPLQTQSFDLIKDGCPTEHGTALLAQLGSPASPKHLCMSFRLPRSKVCSEIFIHIHLKMCLQRVTKTCPDGNTVPACASRKRRSISSVNAEPITIGPIFLIDGKIGQEQVAFLADDAIIDVIPRSNVTKTDGLFNKTPLRYPTLNKPAGYDKTTLSVVTVLAILLTCLGIAVVLLFIHRIRFLKPMRIFH